MNEVPKGASVLKQFGISGADHFNENRKQGLESLKGIVHVHNPEHAHTETMMSNRFLCCANLGPNGKHIPQDEMVLEDFHTKHLTRTDLLELLKMAQADSG